MQLNRPPKFKLLITALIFTGCAIVQPGLRHQAFADEQKSEVEELQTGSDISADQSVAPDESSSVPGKFVGLETLHQGPISVEVRMAQPADVTNVELITPAEAMTFLLGSLVLVSGGLGAAGVTVAVPALVAPLLGGATALGAMVPGGAGLLGLEGYRRSILTESVAKVDLPQLTQIALQRRLGATETSDETAERRVEVVILNYGLSRGPMENGACLFLHARIHLDLPDRETQEESVSIEPGQRSDDAPPAYCTDTKRFLANDGELLRQNLTESAEILAAIVARRLEDKQ